MTTPTLRSFATRRLGATLIAIAGLTAAGHALAQDCPQWQQNGTSLSYTSDDLWSAKSHSVIAGGSIHLTACSSVPGIGYLAQAPDFTLYFTGNGKAQRALEIRAEGTCDTMLLVNDAAAGWHFNDDTNGLDPVIRLANAADGYYDIWVGTIGPDTCSATLELETF